MSENQSKSQSTPLQAAPDATKSPQAGETPVQTSHKSRAILRADDLKPWDDLLRTLDTTDGLLKAAEEFVDSIPDVPGFPWTGNQLRKMRDRIADISDFHADKLAAMSTRREKKLAALEAEKARIERGET